MLVCPWPMALYIQCTKFQHSRNEGEKATMLDPFRPYTMMFATLSQATRAR